IAQGIGDALDRGMRGSGEKLPQPDPKGNGRAGGSGPASSGPTTSTPTPVPPSTATPAPRPQAPRVGAPTPKPPPTPWPLAPVASGDSGAPQGAARNGEEECLRKAYQQQAEQAAKLPPNVIVTLDDAGVRARCAKEAALNALRGLQPVERSSERPPPDQP